MLDISRPHWFCCSSDWRLSRLPTLPITIPASGRSISTNIVSCHEMMIIITRQTMIIMGFLNIMSSDAMMEFSISPTSPVMRAITSPLRSWVKNEIGRATILSNT